MGQGLGPGAEPLRAQLWTYRHRRAIRVVGALVLVAVVVNLVFAARAGESLVSPVLSVAVWASQVVLWGWVFPARLRREAEPPRPSED